MATSPAPANNGVTKFLVIVIFGVLLIIGGLIGYFVIAAAVKKALLEELIIDSKDHKNYDSWVDGFEEDEQLQVRKIYLFNLTNPEDFAAGSAIPKFDEIGPFTYQYRSNKTNVTFLDGGNKVGFESNNVYHFLPELSAYSSDKDMQIVNVSPMYVFFINALLPVGGEAALPGVLTAAVHQLYAKFKLDALWGTVDTLPCAPQFGAVFCPFARFAKDKSLPAIPMSTETSSAVVKTLSDAAAVGVLLQTLPTIAAGSGAAKNAAIAAFVASKVNATWASSTLNLENPAFAPVMAQYLADVASTQFNAAIAGLKAANVPGQSLLFRKSTPYSWIFEDDPVLSAVGMSDTSFRSNNSWDPKYIARTGKDDEKYANMNYYEMVEGVDVVKEYKEEYSVEGRTKTIDPFGGVAPDSLTVYFSTVKRKLEASYSGVEKIKGIETAVYQFETEKITAANDFYKTTTDGMVDMGPVAGGLPTFLSVPHMWHVPNKFIQRIEGMKQEKSYPSRLWIEETTGLALKGERQLQLNCLLNFSKANYSGITPPADGGFEIFVPIFYDIEFGEINDDSAKSLKKAVVDAAILRKLILGILVGFGIALVLIGATLMVQLSGSGSKDANNAGNTASKEPAPGVVADDNTNVKQAAGEDALANEDTTAQPNSLEGDHQMVAVAPHTS